MPVFNKEAYIAEAIESVLSQTESDWELIVIDDKSTDDSMEVVKIYAEQDKRIKWYRNLTNLGIGGTRNAGMAFANGEWIVVMDADDISLPHRLELHRDYSAEYPEVDYFYTSLDVTSPDLRVYDHWVAKEVTKEELDKGNQVVLHGTAIYKNDKRMRYRDDARINDDAFQVLDAWNAGVKFGFVDESTYIYRVTADGVSSVNFKKLQHQLRDAIKSGKEKVLERNTTNTK